MRRKTPKRGSKGRFVRGKAHAGKTRVKHTATYLGPPARRAAPRKAPKAPRSRARVTKTPRKALRRGEYKGVHHTWGRVHGHTRRVKEPTRRKRRRARALAAAPRRHRRRVHAAMPRRRSRRRAMMFSPMRRHARRRYAHSPHASVSGMILYSGGGLLGIQSASLLHRAIVTVDPASTTFKLPAGFADIAAYNENVVAARVPWSSVGAQLGLAFAGGLMGWAAPWGWLKMLMYGFSSGATLHVGTQLIDAYIVEPLIVKMGKSAATAATAAGTPVVQTRGQRYYQHEIDATNLVLPGTLGDPPRDRRGTPVRTVRALPNHQPTRMPSALAYASTLGDQGNMVAVAPLDNGQCPPGAMYGGQDPGNLDAALCFVPAPLPDSPPQNVRPPPMTSNLPPPPAAPPPYVPPMTSNLPPPPAAPPPYVPPVAGPPPSPPVAYPPSGVVPPTTVPRRPYDESCRLPPEKNTPCCGDRNVCTCGSCMGEPPHETVTHPLMAQLQRARMKNSSRSRFAA